MQRLPTFSLHRRRVGAALLGAALAPSWAGARVLRIGVPDGGAPPYYILSPERAPSGLLLELLDSVAQSAGYRMELVQSSRKRYEDMVARDEIATTALAKEWALDPEAFLFTDPVLQVRTVVFSRKQDHFLYTGVASLAGKVVGTRLGYAYPQLDARFSSGQVRREDAPTEASMLAKLLRGRSDVVVMDEQAGRWLMARNGWDGQLETSGPALGEFSVRFMFHPRYAELVAHFNRQFAAMKKDGRWAELLHKYQIRGQG